MRLKAAMLQVMFDDLQPSLGFGGLGEAILLGVGRLLINTQSSEIGFLHAGRMSLFLSHVEEVRNAQSVQGLPEATCSMFKLNTVTCRYCCPCFCSIRSSISAHGFISFVLLLNAARLVIHIADASVLLSVSDSGYQWQVMSIVCDSSIEISPLTVIVIVVVVRKEGGMLIIII